MLMMMASPDCFSAGKQARHMLKVPMTSISITELVAQENEGGGSGDGDAEGGTGKEDGSVSDQGGSESSPVRKPFTERSSAATKKLPAAQLTRMSRREKCARVRRTTSSHFSADLTSPCKHRQGLSHTGMLLCLGISGASGFPTPPLSTA